MVYGVTEDLDTLVAKLVNLIAGTFKFCIRNYEALLPYLEKKEINSKIYHKLVQVNILFNKLNEELVALRAEYETDSLHEQRGETEGDRKRRLSDVIELGRHEAKNMKIEVSFSNSTKCSTALTSGTGINIQTENLVLNGTEDTSNKEVQSLDLERKKIIITAKQDTGEVDDIHELPMVNNQIAVAQKSYGSTNNGMTVCFAGDEASESASERPMDGNGYHEGSDTAGQRGTNEMCVPLQSVKNETISQEKCEVNGKVVSTDHDIYRALQGEVGSTTFASHQVNKPFNSPLDFTTCDAESAVLAEERANSCNKEGRIAPHSPVRYKEAAVQRSEELCNADNRFYGIIKLVTGRYRCTVCNRELFDCEAVLGHVKGKKHKNKKRVDKAISHVKEAILPNVSYKSKLVNSHAVHGHVKVNKQKKKQKPAKKSSNKDTDVTNNNCESMASVSVHSAASCSLADSVAIVKDKHQAISMKLPMTLDSIWTYFNTKFHVNKKFFMFRSEQIICTLCYKTVGNFIFNVRQHVSELNHLNRIKTFRNIEMENKLSNKKLIDIPGGLKNILPADHFSLRNCGFYCNVCNCFCDNPAVLSHITSEKHGRKLDEMKISLLGLQP